MGDTLTVALQAGPLCLDPARHEASVDGRPVTFTALEMRIVYVLAAYPGQVFTADRLCDVVWGEGKGGHPALRVHLKRIRDKLGEHRHLIEAVRGVGYRWTAKSPPPPSAAPAFSPSAALPASPPPDARHLLSTGELAEVVVDIARVLAARPVADADDWAALERLRNHPAVRLLSSRAVPRERAGGAS